MDNVLEVAKFVSVYSPGPYKGFRVMNIPTVRTMKEHNQWVEDHKNDKEIADVIEIIDGVEANEMIVELPANPIQENL